MNYRAYFRQKKSEAACFRTDEHPDAYLNQRENETDDDEDYKSVCDGYGPEPPILGEG